MRAALRSISTAGVTALLFVISTLPTFSQENSTTTIRSITRLVQLNMVVVDKSGKPVTGLSQGEFHVFDNGQEQKLVHFAVSTSKGDSIRASESPLVISNSSPNQQQSPRTMTVILVDEMVDQELEATDLRNVIQQARLALLKFLRTLQPGEQVAIYSLRAEGVVIVHDFTDNSEALVESAKRLGSGLLRSKIHMTPGSSAAATALAGSGYKTALHSQNDALTERIHQVLMEDAFESISEQLHYIPGRKNLVWISATFPMVVAGFDPGVMMAERDSPIPVAGAHAALPIPQNAWPENYTDRLTKFARSLSNANIAVYPMDPRGLVAGIASPSVGPFLSQWGAMDLIAAETGGRAIYNDNRIEIAMRDVMDENHVAYILGYYPGDKAWDGKYHKIQVKADRPGAIVRCRKGYYAKDDAPPEGPDPVLRRAAKTFTDSSGIGVELNVATNPLKWFNQEVVVKVRAQDIKFAQADDRYNGHLEVAFVEIDKDGRVVDGIKDDVNLSLLPGSYNRALDVGWFYPRNLWISTGTEKLRLLVRDVATGNIGSVSIPVEDHFGK